MSRRDALLSLASGVVVAILTVPAQQGSRLNRKTRPSRWKSMEWFERAARRRQSALESVRGVNRANVSFDNREAVVTYDPDVVKVDDLIKALKDAPGMSHFDAKVKKSDTKDKASSKDRN